MTIPQKQGLKQKLIQDIEELKRGQAEILALLKGQVQPQNDNPLDPPLLRGTSEISEFREMVRCGADPHEAFKDIQRRKAVGRKLPTAH